MHNYFNKLVCWQLTIKFITELLITFEKQKTREKRDRK